MLSPHATWLYRPAHGNPTRGCRWPWRRWNIEICQRNPLRSLRRERPERSPRDGIVLNFLPVLIAEHQHGRRGRPVSLGIFARLRLRFRPHVRIWILLTPLPLPFEALQIHLVRDLDFDRRRNLNPTTRGPSPTTRAIPTQLKPMQLRKAKWKRKSSRS